MNRRDVLLSGVAVSTVLAGGVPVALEEMPVLWGDGEHDDTAALQHFLDGGTVQRPDGTVVGDRLEALRFRCTDSLYVTGGELMVSDCAFRFEGPPSGGAWLVFS